jgi:two-component system sensor histidine kinase HydH
MTRGDTAGGAGQGATSRSPFPGRYLVATVLLLCILVGVYTLVTARWHRGEMERELGQQGRALLDAVGASVSHAAASSALIEDLIGQRLLDNARLIDRLIASEGHDPARIQQIVAQNRLRKVEILDRDGKPLSLRTAGAGAARGFGPPPGHRAMMERMMRRMAPGPGRPRAGGAWMPFMWGHRWHVPQDPSGTPPQAPSTIRERRFWEGSDYGVALPATSFPGIIAVHADARFLTQFREEVGLQPLLEDLGRQPGVAYVALLSGAGEVLAHSARGEVGQAESDPALAGLLRDRRVLERRLERSGHGEIYEVSGAIPLGGSRLGVLRVGLSVEPLGRFWRQEQRTVLVATGAILLAGVVGVLAIFLNQRRYMRTVRSLDEARARDQRLAAVGHLAAGVAHEVRNPLNTISMGLQRLRAEFSPPEAHREEYARFTEVMLDEVRRLNETVERFLELARPAPVAFGVCPLGEHVADLATLVRPEAESRRVTLEADLPTDGVAARADCGRLHRALLNLFLNGVQAMPDGGRLRITVRPIRGEGPASPGGWVEIAVSDTGVGIPREDLDRVFEPYFTTKPGGTGLGLALAHRIVEEHGGRLTAESPGPGRGATFRVRLPAVASADGGGPGG